MAKLIRILRLLIVSSRATAIWLLVFATAAAVATFVENDYGTPTARALVYDAWWFEAVMVLLAVNFIANISRYGLWRRGRWSLLTFHLGFVIIILGAGITRYTGYEGMLNIREGSSTSTMDSEELYLQLEVEGEHAHSELKLHAFADPRHELSVGDITLRAVGFIPAAEEVITEGGQHLLHIKVAEGNERPSYYLAQGEYVRTAYGVIAFDSDVAAEVSISSQGDSLVISSTRGLDFMRMDEPIAGHADADSIAPWMLNTIYQSGPLTFSPIGSHPDAKLTYATSMDAEARKDLPGKLLLELTSGEHQTEFALSARKGYHHQRRFQLGNRVVRVAAAPLILDLGFELHLKDFEMVRYPGSRSPSEYSSFLEVVDGDSRFPFHLYMNNVLDYRGFRFFQASFDQDEGGTILSVNHDWWGTWVTYLGYFLMSLGMVWALVARQTRFRGLLRELKRLQTKKAALILVALMSLQTFANDSNRLPTNPAGLYPKEVARDFGALLVQDMDGRTKPVNTLASELVRKLSGGTKVHLNYLGEDLTFNADQFFLSLNGKPMFWAEAPIIAVDPEKASELFEALSIEPAEHLSLQQFFSDQGQFLPENLVAEAHSTAPGQRNAQQKEIIKVDERFNIMYQAISGAYLKLFPHPHDAQAAWHTPVDILHGFSSEDSVFVSQIYPLLIQQADEATESDDWTSVHDVIGYIGQYQQRYAAEIMPPTERVQGELLYNRLKLNLHLFYSYWMLGAALFVIALVRLFSQSKWLRIAQITLTALITILFLAQTFNMGLRWYVGQYPPWSNGYEMIILVAWSTVLFTLAMVRKSQFMVPIGALIAGTLLFVAFLDWLNPEITQLAPVLKSFWMKIHVLIIVASYAPLAVSALLSFTAIWISNFQPRAEKVKLSIQELTVLSEISITVGLYLLAIGTFIGGVWANESWGRYWGWDPKETWALISLLIYAAVAHLRFIPSIRNQPLIFNSVAVVAFFSIIMTSFGVNYYLSGLHSYATGEAVPIPTWVFVLVGFVAVTIGIGVVQKRIRHSS